MAFDSNQWYQMNVPLFGRQSMVGLTPDGNKDAAAVFFTTTNTSAPAQRWQLFPTENDTYILRTRRSSPNTYLAIREDRASRAEMNGSNAIMRRVQGTTNEVFWSISPFKNGGYSLVNVANGTNWHLHAENAGTISMTNNITGEKDNQKFSFTGLGKIDDPTYSSVVLPSGATATVSNSGSKSSPSSGNNGLSAGQKAAIGASVGGVVLIVLITSVALLLRRCRRVHQQRWQQQTEKTIEDPQSTIYHKAELDTGRPEYTAPSATGKYAQHEMPQDGQILEMDASGQGQARNSPVELPTLQSSPKVPSAR